MLNIKINQAKTGVSLKHKKTLPTIYLDDTQNIDQALNDLNQKLYRQTATRWYKRRYGFYEKPSLLKAKRKKMKLILSRRQTHLSDGSNLWLKIEQTEQFAHNAKNAVGY